jgi:hypothetical protein
MFSMSQDAAFYIDAARRCYDMARQCGPADRKIAEELIAIGHQLVERAIRHGAAPEDLPQP